MSISSTQNHAVELRTVDAGSPPDLAFLGQTPINAIHAVNRLRASGRYDADDAAMLTLALQWLDTLVARHPDDPVLAELAAPAAEARRRLAALGPSSNTTA